MTELKNVHGFMTMFNVYFSILCDVQYVIGKQT